MQALRQMPAAQRARAAAAAPALLRALRGAADAGVLPALAAAYRDLFVAVDQMHKRDILGVPRPLLDDGPPPPRGATPAPPPPPPPANRSQLFYPLRDLTRLPDRPDAGLLGGLQGRFMGSPAAYLQVLPNHLEVSYQALSTIMLWPPMEVFHPFAVDYELAAAHARILRRRPLKSGTRRRRKQRRVLVNARTVGLVPRSS
ncbi:MAG: hypothetical protein J3K34DRAFT_522343 [Monoraphidium minutum]|nr:MAG: hypothetical protein J3K34DRAFT_522343 [Monoraphidium minutum]